MLGKVELCGVTTSQLQTLGHEETMELIRQAQKGSSAARDAVIRANLRLVLSVIQKFSARGESADDLFQVGCIGLMKAVDHFNTALDVRFSTYGVPMIVGEIRRYLRDNSPLRITRSIRDTAYQVMQARERLMEKGTREPDADAIAAELGISRFRVIEAMDAVAEPVSLYEPVYGEEGDSICGMDQIGDTKNTDESWLEQIALADAMAALSGREKKILQMRFYRGKTQMQVAEEIGISQAQVSRLEKGAIRQIRQSL